MANLMMPNTSAESNPYQLGPSNQYSGHNAPPVWGGHQHSLIDEDPMFMDRGGHGGPLMGGHHQGPNGMLSTPNNQKYAPYAP